MNIRIVLCLFALTIAVMCGLMFFSSDVTANTSSFYILEVLSVFLVVVMGVLYKKVLTPLQTLSAGLEMLKAQDWNNRLKKVGMAEVDNIVVVFNQLLDRLMSERIRYEEQSRLLHELTEHSPSGIIIADNRGNVALFNPSAVAFVGRISTGMHLSELSGTVGRAVMSVSDEDGDLTVRKDSMTIKCLSRTFIQEGMTFRYFMIENVTETVDEAERRGYEKIIRLMSHEVNNSVCGLVSALDTCMPYIASTDMQTLLTSCIDRASNLSDFIGRYASVVKLPEARLMEINLAGFLEARIPFLQSLAFGRHISIGFSHFGDPSIVKADIVLLEQAVVNIVKNSIESIEASGNGDGRIEISVRSERGKTVMSVTDNGEGIDSEKATKLFTPFYTDKPGGLGIGLMLTRQILHRHGCEYSLSTDHDSGLTCFAVVFP